MAKKNYIGNSPFFYKPEKRPQQIVTIIAFFALGLTVGWGYAFALLGGSVIWSASMK